MVSLRLTFIHLPLMHLAFSQLTLFWITLINGYQMCFQMELGSQFNPVAVTRFQKDRPIQTTSSKRSEFIGRLQMDLVALKHSCTSTETRTKNWEAMQNENHSIAAGTCGFSFSLVLIFFIFGLSMVLAHQVATSYPGHLYNTV